MLWTYLQSGLRLWHGGGGLWPRAERKLAHRESGNKSNGSGETLPVFFLFGEVCGGPLLLLPVFGGSLPCPSLLPGWASQWASLSVCWRSGSGSEGSPSRPATNAGKPEVAQPDAPGTIAAASAAHLQRLALSLGRIDVRAN